MLFLLFATSAVTGQLLQRCKAQTVKYSSPWLFRQKRGRLKPAPWAKSRGCRATQPARTRQLEDRGCEVCRGNREEVEAN